MNVVLLDECIKVKQLITIEISGINSLSQISNTITLGLQHIFLVTVTMLQIFVMNNT